MSDKIPPRPVSLFTIVFLFVLFGAALFTAYRFYAPAPVLAQEAAPENITPELAWRASAADRRQTLNDLVASQRAQENTYAWIDQGAGVVQLPIDRAIQLTAEKYGAKQ